MGCQSISMCRPYSMHHDSVSSNVRANRLILQCRQFSNLANNFLSVALGYAKVIISEAGLRPGASARPHRAR